MNPFNNDPDERRRQAYLELSKEKERAKKLIIQAEEKNHNDRLRDMFAASALQALSSHFFETYSGDNKDLYYAQIADDAYTIAENMLIARSKYVKGLQ